MAALLAIAALTSPLASPASGQSPSLEPPGKPTGLTGEVAHDRVALTWDDPGDASISGYRVLRRDPEVDASGVFTTLIDNTGSALPAYVDREVQPEKRYVYRVQARNAAELSARSRRFVADTPAAPVVRFEVGLPGETSSARAQQTCPGTEDSPRAGGSTGHRRSHRGHVDDRRVLRALCESRRGRRGARDPRLGEEG